MTSTSVQGLTKGKESFFYVEEFSKDNQNKGRIEERYRRFEKKEEDA